MNISDQVVPGGNTLLRLVGKRLSREARRRLQWMDFYARHGHNARLTCRHFGISPDVFYRWQRRYDPRRLESFGERSADPPAPSGAATPDPTSRGRADPGAARGVPALGQS